MRIISGTYKGKRIVAPKKLPTRPTTDMAKESLFNILNNHYYFDAIRVLDLFAGTGNISYEFLSRGTSQITAVDQNRDCVAFINKTNKELKGSIEAYKYDVYKFLEKYNQTADIIFADPPYNFSLEQFTAIVDKVFERNLLAEEGMLILEHSKHSDLGQHPKFSFAKRYGGSIFSFFEAHS